MAAVNLFEGKGPNGDVVGSPLEGRYLGDQPNREKATSMVGGRATETRKPQLRDLNQDVSVAATTSRWTFIATCSILLASKHY